MSKEKLFPRKSFDLAVLVVVIQLLMSAAVMKYVKYVGGKMTGKTIPMLMSSEVVQIIIIL